MKKFIEVKCKNGPVMAINLDNVITIAKRSDGTCKVYYTRTNFSDELEDNYDELMAKINEID
jgi:hypothetical protein